MPAIASRSYPTMQPIPRRVSSIRGLLAFGLMQAVLAPGGAAESEQRLQQRLRRFPEADANGDGVLTEAEARAHQQARKQGGAGGARSPNRIAPAPAPTRAGVAYGPHARNVLDLWRAEGAGPTPVLVFFHGGSFKGGDKSAVMARPVFEACLRAGISVVSANYRYSTEAPYPAPMWDGARAVQFVRTQAGVWGLDPARIAVGGTSAGATLALWIALHDDLAAPGGADPVARASSRVACASAHNGTAGLEPEYLQRQAGVTKLGAALFGLFGASSRAELDEPARRALVRAASPLTHASPDDPPLFLTYAGEPAEAPFPAEAPQSAWIHHVSLGLPLQARYAELGLACELHHRGRPAPAEAEVAFLTRHLRPAAR